MSRWLPYLAELQPELFCEVSPELAAERGLENGGWATIVSARAAIEARVLVTERMTPLVIGGHTVHQIGLPVPLGRGQRRRRQRRRRQRPAGRDPGPERADPGVQGRLLRHPSPGRRPRGEELLRLVAEYQSPRRERPSRPATS